MNPGRAMVLPILLIGFLLAGSGASEEQIGTAMDEALETVELEMSEIQISNPFLSSVIQQTAKATALSLIIAIYFGAFLYTVFPIPEFLFLPLSIFVILDAITIGVFGNLAIKSLFAGFLFGIEKTGLIKLGRK